MFLNRIIISFAAVFISGCNLVSNAQYTGIKFRHITPAEGLSQGSVTSYCQDKNGFIWTGTRDGLNRFDGYTFLVFKYDRKDSLSLSNNHITALLKTGEDHLWVATWGGGLNLFDLTKNKFTRVFNGHKSGLSKSFIYCLAEDSKGYLWIGTDGQGLYRYDKKRNVLNHYTNNPQKKESLSDNTVRTIFEDHYGKIWIGTQNSGLELYDFKTDGFIHFRHIKNDFKTPSGNTIRAICEIDENFLCIGTYGNGFDLMDQSTQEFKNFNHESGKGNSLCHNNIMSMLTDRNGKLWIGTENGGLSIFDIKSSEFINYRNDPFDQSSINNNSIYDLYEDVSGNIWIGTWNGGINLVNMHARQFIHYRHSSDPGSLSDNHVLCITEDSDGMIWVGTDGGGLNLLNPKTGYFINFTHNPLDKNSICGDYVLSVREDGNGEIWIGTYGSGISIYNKKTKTFRHLKSDQNKQHGITSDYIWYIYKDSHDRMWIGMCPGGVNVYDPASDKYTYFVHDNEDSNSLIHNNIHSIFEDSKRNMWIGTNGGGLDKIDPSGKITHFQHNPDSNSISHNCLGHLFEDKKGNLWIGTDGGLDCLDTKTQKIINSGYTIGLPDCFIYGILEDKKHRLWISSNVGLILYDPESGEINRFTVSDGLQSDEFNLNAFCISRTGDMYFGGSNGMNRFHPDSLKGISSDYKLVITDFHIFNKSVPVEETSRSPLTHNISYTRELRLPYKASVFSFEFAALNYLEPGSNTYSYKMENFDRAWNDVRMNRTATYTNLDPGQYIFRVRGGPASNLAHGNTQIKITIVPPFWMTWWFRIAALGIVACFFIVFYRLRIRVIEKRSLLLEEKVEERTSRIVEMNDILKDQTTELNRKNSELEQLNCHLNELNATKDKFFSIIAHDLKNPFNSILGFSEMLANNYNSWKDEKTEHVLKLLYNSAQNLFNLLENLLEWSRSQRGILEFKPETIDLQALIRDCIVVFKDSLMAKNLNLIVSGSDNPIAVYADRQMLGTMIRNLISNAIKYTNKNGEIRISAEFNGTDTFIIVSDNGIGMSSKKSDMLFRIDSGSSTPGTENEKGTGLGLLLTREFVSRHGGDIQVSSKPGKGSTFTISLPWNGTEK